MASMDEISISARQRIANWNTAATFEDIERTFVTAKMASDFDGVKSGSKWLVLGRKGAGKSAFVNKIESSITNRDLFQKHEFDPNVLGRRLEFFDKNFDISNASSVFKLDILLLAAKELAPIINDHNISKEAKLIGEYYSRTRKNISIKARTNFAWFLEFVSPYLGFGGAGRELRQSGIFSNPGIVADEVYSTTKSLARVVNNSAFPGKVYIIFDEIDLKLSDYKNSPSYDKYLMMLKSLISAASSFDDIRRNGVPVYPIIVLRDDIFRTIDVADQNKWERNSVRVQFGRGELEDLLRYRIKLELLSAGFGAMVNSESFDQIWGRLVDPHQNINGKPIVELFFDRTMHRPRDVVQFLKLLCERSVHSGSPERKINTQLYREAKNIYSEYFWNELMDELGYAYPYATRFNTLLRDIFFSKKGSKYNYNVYVAADSARQTIGQFCEDLRQEGYTISTDNLIQDFYKRSIFGVQRRTDNGLRTFYYFQDRLDRDVSGELAITLHRSIADYLIRRNRASGL